MYDELDRSSRRVMWCGRRYMSFFVTLSLCGLTLHPGIPIERVRGGSIDETS